MSKGYCLNAISLWVSVLIDFCQRTEGIWDENVNLDEQILMLWTESI